MAKDDKDDNLKKYATPKTKNKNTNGNNWWR